MLPLALLRATHFFSAFAVLSVVLFAEPIIGTETAGFFIAERSGQTPSPHSDRQLVSLNTTCICKITCHFPQRHRRYGSVSRKHKEVTADTSADETDLPDVFDTLGSTISTLGREMARVARECALL